MNTVKHHLLNTQTSFSIFYLSHHAMHMILWDDTAPHSCQHVYEAVPHSTGIHVNSTAGD
jgi:hypothetical protein